VKTAYGGEKGTPLKVGAPPLRGVKRCQSLGLNFLKGASRKKKTLRKKKTKKMSLTGEREEIGIEANAEVPSPLALEILETTEQKIDSSLHESREVIKEEDGWETDLDVEGTLAFKKYSLSKPSSSKEF
jgi:hypothetical protein